MLRYLNVLNLHGIFEFYVAFKYMYFIYGFSTCVQVAEHIREIKHPPHHLNTLLLSEIFTNKGNLYIVQYVNYML